jgi:hypothetical protein
MTTDIIIAIAFSCIRQFLKKTFWFPKASASNEICWLFHRIELMILKNCLLINMHIRASHLIYFTVISTILLTNILMQY